MAPSEKTIPHLQWLLERPWRLLAFGFGSGLSKLAPGTVGTLWAWAFALFVQPFFATQTPLEITLLWVGGFLLGIWACGNTGDNLGVPDHSGMVWDEILAFWLILLFVLPANWQIQLLAFGLFRFFDIAKPGPIRFVDRWFKDWQPKGYLGRYPSTVRGFGVMIDDILAAFLTLIVISIFIHLGF
jgi:phosphatidylglycerophosphatase A